MSVVIDGSAGITTPGITDSAALALTGTGAKVTGDFTNATVASRNSFQTSTTNGSTGIYALPNGTSTAASWQATNAADPTNASKILIATNGSTDVQLVSGINGTGTYLPLSFYTNGTQQMQLSTAGILTGTAGNLMLVQGTAQNSTSGTTVDFTNIPSWAKRIIVTLNGVSLSGSSDILIQLGTSGGFVNTGYNSVSARISGAGAANTTATNGFNVTGGMAAAANLVYGAITIANHTGNTWVESGVLSATGTAYVLPSGGSIALAAALTQVRITTANGTDTFDAGSINIQYE